MRMIKILLSLTLLTQQASSQDSLKIIGNCPLIDDGTEITLVEAHPRRFSNCENKIKTVTAKHRFTFNVEANGAESFLLYANNNILRLYLESGKADILISDSTLKSVKVYNNTAGSEYSEFVLRQSSTPEAMKYNSERLNYFRHLKNNDTPSIELQALKGRVDSLLQFKQESDKRLSLNFINQHPKSHLNSYLLYNVIDDLPEDILKQTFNDLPITSRRNTWGRELSYHIDSLFVGGSAPLYSQQDTSGKTITSSSFKGKYLLIDFWASWCIPCRAENPNLLTAYQKYHHKGLEILAVSLDKERQKWLKAIKEDGLPWQQVSDLKGFDNDISKSFYVYAIPDNYLIGPDGKIIAKNLRGSELQKKLTEIFK